MCVKQQYTELISLVFYRKLFLCFKETLCVTKVYRNTLKNIILLGYDHDNGTIYSSYVFFLPGIY